MKTIKMEASRGYCGCKHSLIYHRSSRFVGSRRYKSSRIQNRSFFEEIFTILMIFVIIFITCTHEYYSSKSNISINIGENILQQIDLQFDAIQQIPKSYLKHSKLTAGIINELGLQRKKAISFESKIKPEKIVIEQSNVEMVEMKPVDPIEVVNDQMGNDVIEISNGSNTILRRYDLPTKYYPGLDFSSFQPYMDYRCITDKSSPAYAVTRSVNTYNDEYGLRRYVTTEDQFTINGQDDYVIALGTFYKEEGTAGSRYLIVTTTGMYTAITGDEKDNRHTDAMNMYSLHADGTCAGIIEWIVDTETLESNMKRSGTITKGPVKVLQGEVIQIYGIE